MYKYYSNNKCCNEETNRVLLNLYCVKRNLKYLGFTDALHFPLCKYKAILVLSLPTWSHG